MAEATTSTLHTAPAGSLLSRLPDLTLSEKMKFAVKAALSIVIVYLVAFSQGWQNPLTAATTIMLIASVGSLGDSVFKGMLRIIGTLIGAVLGMVLIALFPQERFVYLLSVSLAVAVLLYLARAYKGDMTIFLLSAITLMMMFQNGEVDSVFLYGVDKTFMTIFGIAVYTLVGILLWPVDVKDESMEQAQRLTQTMRSFYPTLFEKERQTLQTRYAEMLTQERAFASSLTHLNGGTENGFSASQWASVHEDFKKITETLTLLSYQEIGSFDQPIAHYFTNFNEIDSDIRALFGAIEVAWHTSTPITIQDKAQSSFDPEALKHLSQLQRATLSAVSGEMLRLHSRLRTLAAKLNALNAPAPTHFDENEKHRTPLFLWFDPEDLKGTLITLMIFWSGVWLWITINPPGGFIIVAIATGLSVITTFSEVKPSLLIIVFSVSFVFATLAYLFVLPYLTYGWQLGMFLFVYAFAAFYLIKTEVAIFFLLGIATWNLANTMYYAFDLFLLTLFVFYAFLSLLLFFYYIPFSTKPETMLLTLHRRFFAHAKHVAAYDRLRAAGKKPGLFKRLQAWYARTHLMPTVGKMQLWTAKLDTGYFHTFNKEKMLAFTKSAEQFAYLLLLYHRMKRDNPLIRAYVQEHETTTLPDMLALYETTDLTEVQQKAEEIIEKKTEESEATLERFFTQIDTSSLKKEALVGFYEEIALHKSLWQTFAQMRSLMGAIDLNQLKESRF